MGCASSSNVVMNKRSGEYPTVLTSAKRLDWCDLASAPAKVKNDEAVVISCIKQSVCALQYASDEMKNNETVVLAAVRKCGGALNFVSSGMKNTEIVVFTAVEKDGYALQFASPEMKNNACIVLAAVLQNDQVLSHASDEVQAEIRKSAAEMGVSLKQYAEARLNKHTVVQVALASNSSPSHPELVCSNLAGEELVSLTFDPNAGHHVLHREIAARLLVPHFALHVVLPGGQEIGDHVDIGADLITLLSTDRM